MEEINSLVHSMDAPTAISKAMPLKCCIAGHSAKIALSPGKLKRINIVNSQFLLKQNLKNNA